MTTEQAFAPFIRALGRGKKSARSLTREEARTAFQAVLNGDASPVQIGAFLMLLRMKEETAEELAGFVEAVRHTIAPVPTIATDLDWSSYAGKRKHAPWFVLSALLLANNGIRVFMHGTAGHTAGRLYTEDAFATLGLPMARDWQAVQHALDHTRLCFMPLSCWCPALQDLIDLRAQFGLRSPVHTLVRLVNPTSAPCSLQSIFHPAYAENHSHAAWLLQQPQALVIKGDGGEFEYRPDADTKLFLVQHGERSQQHWARHFPQPCAAEDTLNITDLARVWRGEITHPYAEAAIIGTVALVLRALARADQQTDADALAQAWWQQRNTAWTFPT